MYRIAICNNQDKETLVIIEIITQSLDKHHIHYDINIHSTILAFYREHLSIPYHLLIINTAFSNDTGIKNCHFLRQYNFYQSIIILSNSYAAFHQSSFIFPLSYFIVPLDKKQFSHSLLYAYYASHTKKSISFHNQQGTFTIPLHKILYIESKRNYLYIHTHSQTYYFKYKMNTVLVALNHNFIRCHQSYIVNIHYISGTHRYSLELHSKILIPISKKYSKEVHTRYQLYLDTYSFCL